MKTSTWQNIRLKEICLEKEGLRRGPFGSAIKKEFFVPEGYKVYEQANAIYDDAERGKYFISESKYKELENFWVKEGDFIVSCSGTLGRISQIPKGAKAGVINQALLRIRLRNGIVLNKYFLYYFRSSFFQRKIVEESQGTAMSNLIGIKDFKEMEVPIPSIEDQEHIVSKIEELFSELDKSIEQLKTTQEQLKVYRQSVLKWAFDGALFETSHSWKFEKFKDCLTFSQGVQVDVKKQSLSKNKNQTRFLRIIDFTQGDEAPRFVDDPGERYKVNASEISLVRYGASTGFVCTGLEGAIANNLFKVTPSKEINGKFLFHFLNSIFFQNVVAQKIKGAAMPAISFGLINDIEMPIPTIDEQHKIVQEIESRFSVADKLEETITNSLQQAEALRQSILKKAFEGKLVSNKIGKQDEPNQ